MRLKKSFTLISFSLLVFGSVGFADVAVQDIDGFTVRKDSGPDVAIVGEKPNHTCFATSSQGLEGAGAFTAEDLAKENAEKPAVVK